MEGGRERREATQQIKEEMSSQRSVKRPQALDGGVQRGEEKRVKAENKIRRAPKYFADVTATRS